MPKDAPKAKSEKQIIRISFCKKKFVFILLHIWKKIHMQTKPNLLKRLRRKTAHFVIYWPRNKKIPSNGIIITSQIDFHKVSFLIFYICFKYPRGSEKSQAE